MNVNINNICYETYDPTLVNMAAVSPPPPDMRGFMTQHGLPDCPRSARYILKDYVSVCVVVNLIR